MLTDARGSLTVDFSSHLSAFLTRLGEIQAAASDSASSPTHSPFSRAVGLFVGVLAGLLRPALGILAESLIVGSNNGGERSNDTSNNIPSTSSRKRPFAQ